MIELNKVFKLLDINSSEVVMFETMEGQRKLLQGYQVRNFADMTKVKVSEVVLDFDYEGDFKYFHMFVNYNFWEGKH